MSKEHSLIEYGSKNISIDINIEKRSASVRFGTREPLWLHKRVGGETTFLFSKADELLNEISKIYGPITLTFDTANNKLKLWAHAQKENFNFSEITIDGDLGYRITVVKKYGVTYQEPQILCEQEVRAKLKI